LSATIDAKAVALPLLAVVLVVGVLGVQLANGGGSFTPLRPANPCSVGNASSVSTGTDGLTERLVVLGLDRAACRLHTTREALILQLAQPQTRTSADIDALRAGLLDAIDRMEADHTLPSPSALVAQAVDQSNLNALVKAAIRALPASAIDRSFTTDGVLRDTVNNLDFSTLLANLHDPGDLTQQVNFAVAQAIGQALLGHLRDLL
jgi:hypothetical protein